MNTTIEILAPSGVEWTLDWQRGVDAVREVFEEVERRLSRFQPQSELSALNRSAGEPISASPLLFHAVTLAVEAARATGGLFDPSVLPALEAAGYDRSFELIAGTTVEPIVSDRQRSTTVLSSYRSIRCDDASWTIQLDPGQRLDLGGIGKGLAVDLALEAADSLPNVCINAGGDIVVRGAADLDGGEDGWTIALEDAGSDAALPCVLLRDAAMATSTILKRRWTPGGEELNHLIDPRTGRPSESPLRSVAVVAATCAQADVAAKTALLMGEGGMAFLEERGMHGFAVRHDGSTVATTLWPGRETS
jgi:thiamine biosynthesis lipoprotein